MKSENKSNISIHLTDQLSRIKDSVTETIGEDLKFLKPTIDFPQLSHSIPELKKVLKSQTTNESEVKSKLDEINAKIVALDTNDFIVDNEDLDLELLKERTNSLEKVFPTFKRIANTFTEKNPNNDHSLNQNQIEINDHKMDQLLKTGQQIKHFQSSQQYLKKFNH